jgi:hypothetical protein
MSRITRKQLDSLEQRLNVALDRPTVAYENGQAQLGHVHLYGCNGALNIYEMASLSGGVRGLAYGLSTREAYEWLSGALTALQLTKGDS